MLGSGRGGDGRTRIRGNILVEFRGVGDVGVDGVDNCIIGGVGGAMSGDGGPGIRTVNCSVRVYHGIIISNRWRMCVFCVYRPLCWSGIWLHGGDTHDRDVVIYRWWLIIVGSISRVNTSSVSGDAYDRNVVIYRWWLIVVRGGIIFIDI